MPTVVTAEFPVNLRPIGEASGAELSLFRRHFTTGATGPGSLFWRPRPDSMIVL